MADGSAKVSFAWADGTYDFRLGLSELRALQEKTECGPLVLWRRILAGEWRVDDLGWTIQYGLEGGGLKPMEASKLRARYVDERPLLESIEPASKILEAALVGAEDDPVKKAQAAQDATATSEQTASSPSPPSSDMAQQSV